MVNMSKQLLKTKNGQTVGIQTRLASSKIKFDKDSLPKDLTKLYSLKCSTRKPKSRGICFLDVYVDENWTEAEKRPSNNCYISLPHFINITQEMF